MAGRYRSKIVVFAENKRDAESTELLLREQGLETEAFFNVDSVCAALSHGASALILAKEVITRSSYKKLATVMASQPKWSSIPVVLMITAEDLAAYPDILDTLAALGNIILLERPVRVNTLLSAVRNCLADRKRQYEVRDLLESLETSKDAAIKAKENADKANRSKSDFLANMSHEIRTPLGAVMGFSDLMALPEISLEEREHYARIVKRNGQLLSALIDDVLDLAKIESGNLMIENIDTSLDELLADVIASLQAKAQEKTIPIHIERAHDVPIHLKTDPLRLKQIILNLVGNAIKFTQRGNISLKVTRPDPDFLNFEVSDTGIGIASQDQHKLFQAFSQADGSITRKFGGSGLGLVLSRQLARALGGDLRLVKSQLGRGSTFSFSIACRPVAERLYPTSTKGGLDSTHAGELKGLTVLVADDSPDNRTLILHILGREGVKVFTACDGEEALSLALKSHFDVILMDVQMPKLSGLDAVTELRRQGYSRPIVGLSAYAMSEDRERGLAVGCNAYLTKPINRSELLQTLKSYCSIPA